MQEVKKENAAMPTDLKLKNRIKILDKFRECPEVTISDIMKQTGISRQTIVKSIDYFVKCGLITSLGKGSSSDVGGKKPELYKFNPNFKYIICVRFKDDTLIVALMNLNSEILCIYQREHEKNEKLDILLNDFKELYNKIIEEANISQNSIYGVGICISGICNMETGIMRYNSLYPSWGQDIEIVKMFKEILPQNYEIIISNEGKMTGMAELYYDKTLEEKDIVVIYSHVGICSAHIKNGEVQRGANELVGEIGHMCLNPLSEEKCQCGSNGCFEMLVSENKVNEIIKNNSKKFDNSSLSKISKSNHIALQDLFNEADNGDDFSREIVSYLAKYFAIALKNIMLNIDPEIIIIQGVYATSGKYFKNELDRNIINFKYFPKNGESKIIFDNRDAYKMALLGTSITLIKNLFADESLYKSKLN